jgi:hypothetical protein
LDQYIIRNARDAMSIVCYPFKVTSCNTVNSIVTLLCSYYILQRFLLASTFLSSSLKTVSVIFEHSGICWQHLLQLCGKVLARIIIVPALLPQMRIVAWYLSLLLCPVYQHVSSGPANLISGYQESNVLSTGKSSNSSSSSNAAAGFVSFVESALLSVAVALVVGGAPDAGAADMMGSVRWYRGA